MNRLTVALLLGLASWSLQAQNVARPPIIGVAHISLLARNFEASRAFYRGMLGFEEPYSLTNKDGSPSMTFFKVNERQYIELAPEKQAGTSRISHIALQVDDAEAMRKYLASRGVTVPDHVPTGRIGNLNFMIKDPQGMSVEIVQYGPKSWTVQNQGKFLGQNRISSHMMHVGFVVTNTDAELRFYEDVLGFHEFWRGSKDGKALSWINLRLPESDDYIELMLYGEAPPVKDQGSANHLCLEVPNAEAAIATLTPRAAALHYTRPLEVHTGKNRKRQVNLFDPDGTRTELMEGQTVDGVPAPPSTAPLPTPAPDKTVKPESR